MWGALEGLSRYIATPTVAKHRLFAWCDVRVCPDHQLIVIARDDDTTFGILHSRFHELPPQAMGFAPDTNAHRIDAFLHPTERFRIQRRVALPTLSSRNRRSTSPSAGGSGPCRSPTASERPR